MNRRQNTQVKPKIPIILDSDTADVNDLRVTWWPMRTDLLLIRPEIFNMSHDTGLSLCE